MSVLRMVSVDFTTDGSGDATVYSDPVTGFLEAVTYVYGDAATGGDITITDEATGVALLTITNAGTANLQWRPRVGAHPVANTGAGTLIPGGTTTGGDGIAQYRLPVVGRIKIVVASGGDTKSGTLDFYLSR